MAKSVKANPEYVGKKIKRLDGKIYKVTGTTARGYNIEGFKRALRAVYVKQKGRGLIEMAEHPDPKWADLPNPDLDLFNTNKGSKPKKERRPRKPSTSEKRPKKPEQKIERKIGKVDFDLAKELRSEIAHKVVDILADDLRLQNVSAYYNDNTIQIVVNVTVPEQKEVKKESVERKRDEDTGNANTLDDMVKGMMFENDEGLYTVEAKSKRGDKVKLKDEDGNIIVVSTDTLLSDFEYVEDDEEMEDEDNEEMEDEDFEDEDEDEFEDDEEMEDEDEDDEDEELDDDFEDDF